MNPYKDYEKWDCAVLNHQDIATAVASFKQDGIHSIKSPQSESEAAVLDILVAGGMARSDVNYFLVTFTGAVGPSLRSTSSPPYFSGRGIAGKLNIPMIAFADPSLASKAKIGLAWYAGSEDYVSLVDDIREVVHAAAVLWKKTPIFIGGSGGGYASLQVCSLLNLPNYCVVWNPQTAISRYHRGHAENYLKASHPSRYAEAKRLKVEPTIANLNALPSSNSAILDELPAIHSVSESSHVLYLQNAHDKFHLKNHAGPYFKGEKIIEASENLYFSSTRNIALYVGNWGPGHTPIPAAGLLSILNSIIAGSTLPYVACNFANAREYALNRRLGLLASANISSSMVQFSRKDSEDGSVEIEVIPDVKLGKKEDFTYAFFPCQDDVKLESRWYTASPVAALSKELAASSTHLLVFLQDLMGNKKSFRYNLKA